MLPPHRCCGQTTVKSLKGNRMTCKRCERVYDKIGRRYANKFSTHPME